MSPAALSCRVQSISVPGQPAPAAGSWVPLLLFQGPRRCSPSLTQHVLLLQSRMFSFAFEFPICVLILFVARWLPVFL